MQKVDVVEGDMESHDGRSQPGKKTARGNGLWIVVQKERKQRKVNESKVKDKGRVDPTK